MTKADLIESIYEKVGLSKKEASQIVELIFELMRNSLEDGEKVKISGFGNFNIRDKKVRRGRNPQTGKPMDIPASKVVKFTVGKILKDSVK